MKTLIAIAALFAATTLYADTTKNPDRYFSIGLDYNVEHMNGANPAMLTYQFNGTTLPATFDKTQYDEKTFTMDARMPLTNAITLTAHGGPITQQAYNTTSTGYSLGAGVRFYFIGN